MPNESNQANISVEKLKDGADYASWKIGMQAYRQQEDIWGCVTGDAEHCKNAKKVIRAT